MKELEILQQRFSDMAVQFPGVMHVLTIWPKDEKEPKLNPKYMPTQDNLIEIWGNGLIGEYTPGRNMKHWLLKPTHTLWNKDHDVERFRTLAGNAGQMLIEHGFLSHIKVSDSIAKFSEYSLNIRQAAQFWVLVAHELGNSEKSVCDFRDRKAVWMNILGKDASCPKQNHGYYEVQKDFFLESSLVITQLLELEKAPNQTTTNHSPDFRSVKWFGEIYYFTPTQAAIVKVLWQAWENNTPDVGQETLIENIGSDSHRLVDIFKGHETYKQIIGPGKTRGSFQLIEPDKK